MMIVCAATLRRCNKPMNKEQEQELHNMAYELRLSGKTYREIGMSLDISHVTAYRWVRAHMDSVTLPLIEEVRKQEVDRLTRYLDRLDARVDEGDDRAIALAIKISESLRKLLGADVPVTTTVEHVEVSQLDMDIRKLIDAQNSHNQAAKDLAARKTTGDTNEGNGSL
jgi:transposase